MDLTIVDKINNELIKHKVGKKQDILNKLNEMVGYDIYKFDLDNRIIIKYFVDISALEKMGFCRSYYLYHPSLNDVLPFNLAFSNIDCYTVPKNVYLSDEEDLNCRKSYIKTYFLNIIEKRQSVLRNLTKSQHEYEEHQNGILKDNHEDLISYIDKEYYVSLNELLSRGYQIKRLILCPGNEIKTFAIKNEYVNSNLKYAHEIDDLPYSSHINIFDDYKNIFTISKSKAITNNLILLSSEYIARNIPEVVNKFRDYIKPSDYSKELNDISDKKILLNEFKDKKKCDEILKYIDNIR